MAAAASPSHDDGTGLVVEEDTWNAIPPPPPPTAPSGFYPSSEAVEVVNLGLQHRAIDDHNDSCTLGSDTMNALGAADVALAWSVAQTRGAPAASSFAADQAMSATDHRHVSDAVSSVAEGSLTEQSLREDVTLAESPSEARRSNACGDPCSSGRGMMGDGCGTLEMSNCNRMLKYMKGPAESGMEIESYLLPAVDGPLEGADDTVDIDVTQPQLSPSTEAFLAAKDGNYVECPEGNELNWGPPEKGFARQIDPKPFLRKGSRREPSSLHRMQQRSNAVENDSTDEMKSLEHLEKMQQDQIEQLERRIARRDEAQKEQRKRKQQSKARQTMQNQVKAENELGGGINRQLTNRSPHEVASVAREQADDACPADELHIVGDAVKGDEEMAASIERPSAASTKSSGRKERPSNQPTQKRRVPLKPKQKLASSEVDENADQKQRNDEQWQMLKSMRRRQEAALQEAERERETVKAWAISERASVQKWADEQRVLIRREKHRASNAAMASQREKQKEDTKQRAAAADDQKRSKAEIDALRATVQKFRAEMDGAKAQYKANETRMRDKLRARNETIRLLQEKVASLEKTAPKVSAEKSDVVEATSPSAAKVKGAKAKKDHAAKSGDRKLPKRSSSQKPTLKDEPADSTEPSPAYLDADDANKTTNVGEMKGEEDTPAADETRCGNDSGNPTAAEESGDNDRDAQRRKEMINDLMEEPTEHWLQRLQQRQQSSTAFSDNDRLIARANEVVRSCEPKSTEALHHKKPYNVNDYIDATPSLPSLGSNVNVHGPPATHVAPAPPNSTGRSRTEHACSDGRRVISYRNGTRKETFADGTTKVHFVNGDVKTSYANQSVVVYYYAAAKTTHVSHGEGLEVFEFPNKQTEKHFPDGKKEIFFADGTVKVINPNGASETVFTDGVRVLEMPDGTKQVIQH